MIHYHGTPITPRAVLHQLAGRSFCVPFIEPRDIAVCHEIGEGVMLDSGAFSAWTRKKTIDWDAYMDWCEPWLHYPTTWAVIPDVIGGSEAANDLLLARWFQRRLPRGAPVWHMHESFDRLKRLAAGYPRVCLGSSGDFAQVGTPAWHARMSDAMDALCGSAPVPVWLHMLRGLNLSGSDYPFASADSTNIARNHNGNNTRNTAPKDADLMARRIDARQCTPSWLLREPQLGLEAAQ